MSCCLLSPSFPPLPLVSPFSFAFPSLAFRTGISRPAHSLCSRHVQPSQVSFSLRDTCPYGVPKAWRLIKLYPSYVPFSCCSLLFLLVLYWIFFFWLPPSLSGQLFFRTFSIFILYSFKYFFLVSLSLPLYILLPPFLLSPALPYTCIPLRAHQLYTKPPISSPRVSFSLYLMY